MEELNILDKLRTKPIINEELFSSFFKLIKKKLVKRCGDKLKTVSITLLNSKYYYKSLVDTIKKSSNESIEDKAIEIIGNLFFDIIEKNPIINKDQKILEAPKLENYLFHEILSVLNSKISNSNDKIKDIIKLNHLIFYSEDSFQVQRLSFFIIINEFINQKYNKFSNYDEYFANLYYLYYRYSNKDNLKEFREEILSKIDSENYSNISIDEDSLNEKYIENLLTDLESLTNNNKVFRLNINQNLLNNKRLLKLFNLNEINIERIKQFFSYSLITQNYSKYTSSKEKNIEISVDDLEYKTDKLNVFNIFFLITCGLVNKIDKECLQIFNEDNKAKILFKKYAKILLDNLNDYIKCIENKSNDIPNKNERFGFGKIFNSFHVLYSDLNDDKYKIEELKFDLTKNPNGDND